MGIGIVIFPSQLKRRSRAHLLRHDRISSVGFAFRFGQFWTDVLYTFDVFWRCKSYPGCATLTVFRSAANTESNTFEQDCSDSTQIHDTADTILQYRVLGVIEYFVCKTYYIWWMHLVSVA